MPKTIVVIGASRGIGKALVEQLAADSDNKILAFARSFGRQPVFRELENVRTFQLDLASPNVRAELETAVRPFGQIDILINNAGAIVVKPFLELTHTEIANTYQVNIIGVMQSIQACLPLMEKGAHIVNISSMGGFQGTSKFAGLSAYSTSKAALVSLTELLAEEYKDSGIAINCLCLGAVQTEMLEEAFPGYVAPLNASEMASYICDFALTANRFMHGRIIPVSMSTP